jgi:hypothetical protein
MNRSTFLKRLGISIAAIVVAPKVIAEIKPEDVAKFEPGNIFPKHDVLACVQDQLKDAGDFKPSLTITDLPIEFDEKKHAILYSNGSPIAVLNNFTAEINMGYRYGLDDDDWRVPIPNNKRTSFRGETKTNLLNFMETELFLRFVYSDKVVMQGNVYIDQIRMDAPIYEERCFELEMSLCGTLAIENI